MNLRQYQQDGKAEILDAFRQGYRSVIYCLPTGGGKTAVIGSISRDAVDKNRRVLIITDRQELLSGSAKAILSFGLHPNLITAKTKFLNPSHYCYVAMSQTLKRRIKDAAYMRWVRESFDLIMIDECHKEEFNIFFESALFQTAHVIGFTATPSRRGNSRQLGADYQKIIFGPTVQELIAMGYLAMPSYVKVDTNLDFSSVRISKISGEEDYRDEDVAKVVDTKIVYVGMVEKYKTYANDTLAIVFCPNVATAIKACVEFNESGISSKFLVTEPKSEEGKKLFKEYGNKYTYRRERLLEDFGQGKFKVLVNAGILTTGYDNPLVRTVIIDRITMSDNLLQQMCGRGSRFIKGVKEDFIIIDMYDNFDRLGEWHLPRHYSLWHSKKSGGLPPMKVCPKCKWNVFASAKICNNIVMDTGERCNFVFPSKSKVEVIPDMVLTSYGGMKYNEIKQLCATASFKQISQMAKEKSFPPSWVYRMATEYNRLDEYYQYIQNESRIVA